MLSEACRLNCDPLPFKVNAVFHSDLNNYPSVTCSLLFLFNHLIKNYEVHSLVSVDRGFL